MIAKLNDRIKYLKFLIKRWCMLRENRKKIIRFILSTEPHVCSISGSRSAKEQ
jgi:hypothetical protein